MENKKLIGLLAAGALFLTSAQGVLAAEATGTVTLDVVPVVAIAFDSSTSVVASDNIEATFTFNVSANTESLDFGVTTSELIWDDGAGGTLATYNIPVDAASGVVIDYQLDYNPDQVTAAYNGAATTMTVNGFANIDASQTGTDTTLAQTTTLWDGAREPVDFTTNWTPAGNQMVGTYHGAMTVVVVVTP